MTDILVITGLSGAGRSEAADDLEDLGWFVVDNLPTSLIEKVAELGGGRGSTIGRLALVVGSGTHQADILEVIGRLRSAGHRVRVLFLEAATPALVSRYGSTRRKHPLSDGSQSVLDLIEQERELLEPVRAMADLVIDTTDLNVHQLKARLRDVFGPEGSDGRHADGDHVVRLQARPAARRRPRARLPLPAEPATGWRGCATRPAWTTRSGSTCSATA